MDVDNIIFIIVWAVIIIASLVSSSKNKKKVQQEAQKQGQAPRRRTIQKKPVQKPLVGRKPSEPNAGFKPWGSPIDNTDDPLTLPSATQLPQPSILPDEGQRVTKKKKRSEPMAPNPTKTNPLSNKETLKQAIIYGQMLQPKYDA